MFFIAMFTKMEKTELGWLDVGSSRTVGYKESFEQADRAVRENHCDICEAIYEYACIEELEAGLYPDAKNVWWYKWDPEMYGYAPIDEPECAKGSCNFSIC